MGVKELADAKRLLAVLETVQPYAIKLRSLAAKGQVFKFNNCVKCQNAVRLLNWHFDRIEALAVFIGSTSLNWQNPQVRALLEKMIAIDPDEIRKGVADSNVALVEFATDTYQRIYG